MEGVMQYTVQRSHTLNPSNRLITACWVVRLLRDTDRRLPDNEAETQAVTMANKEEFVH